MACGSVIFTNTLPGNILNSTETSKPFFSATWIGHSTVLIQIGNTTILTDPVMFDRIGLCVLGYTVGLQRYTKPAIPVEQLPKIDIVLLSHAHIDHMDFETLNWLTNHSPNQISCITAKNTADIINDLKWKSLTELDWNESISINGVNIIGREVLHNGWRLPGEKCRRDGYKRTGRSYNGYVIEQDGLRIAFGGDTAYTKSFTEFGNTDVSIMPIGAYQGYSDNHCTPEEALQMTKMMKSPVILPIHFGTFHQSSEPVWEPIHRLMKYTEGIQIVGTKVGYRFKL
jgi:hypothetical protein